MKPHPEYLRAILSYNSTTGDLFWQHREDRDCQWNTRWAGKKAGYINSKGYIYVNIDKKRYLSHRIIWALVHGNWPKNQIDHIDGNPSNNRLENLREATNQENNRNKSLQKNNTSDVTGVSWNKKVQKWVARIATDRKDHHIGVFDNKDDAIAARKDAEVVMFKEFQYKGAH